MRKIPTLFFLIALLCPFATPPSASAQGTIRGQVTDASTGKPLPQANLQIKGTYTGTITNNQGRYTLTVDRLPATVLVRYIGYEAARLRVTEETSPQQDVALQPTTVDLDEVVVTGSDNPGRTLMRKVIEQKQTWWDDLETYTVDAFSRYTVANDTGIVALYETQTKAFWDRGQGTREVVRARRQTENLRMLEGALPAASSVLNLYRDNVTVAEAELMGVTHPDALDRYSFTLDTTRALNGQQVHDIRVEPKTRLASAFVGRVSVLDSAHAMIEAKLRPAQSLRLPRIVEHRTLSFEQQFSNFGGRYWLPVDFRAERRYKVAVSALLSFPRITIDQVSRLSGYELNVPLPDSLSEKESGAIVESARASAASPARTDSAGIDSIGAGGPFVPLSEQQRRIYAERDSAQSLEQAFQPSGLMTDLADLSGSGEGLTLRVGSEEAPSDPTGTDTTGVLGSIDLHWPTPRLRYNRVEGPFVGGMTTVDLGSRVSLELKGGHSFFLDAPFRWSYGGRLETTLPTDALDQMAVEYRYGVDPRYDAEARLFPLVPRGINSLWTLFGEADSYDYFGNERLRIGLQGSVPGMEVEAALQFRNERHRSVTEVSDYNVLGRSTVFGRSTRQPPNPPVNEGQMRSLALSLQWGDDPPLFGVFPVNRVQLDIEHTGDWLQSDFAFTRAEGVVDVHLNTFFRRRTLPNTLDLRAVAGGTLGTLPLQRFGVIEASPLPYTPFGALRTLDDRPYQGTEHAALFWEHNFRTVPFELLGLTGLADRHVEVILHGGHGRAWIDEDRETALRRRDVFVRSSEEIHHELGVSVNGLLRDMLRVDVTARLDRRAFSMGVSLLRFI